jgi:hypothetical protein
VHGEIEKGTMSNDKIEDNEIVNCYLFIALPPPWFNLRRSSHPLSLINSRAKTVIKAQIARIYTHRDKGPAGTFFSVGLAAGGNPAPARLGGVAALAGEAE